METILRRKVRSSLKITFTFAVGIVLLYCTRSVSLYLEDFLANALFLIVIKVCMVMYALHWVSEMINVWEKGNGEIRTDKHDVIQKAL